MSSGIIYDVYKWNKEARGMPEDGVMLVNWPLLRQAMKHAQEEQQELEDAVKMLEARLPQADEEEQAKLFADFFDAICDSIWVRVNAMWACGMPSPESFWDTVVDANNRKFLECQACMGEGCEDCRWTGEKVILDADLKIQKPPGWKGPQEDQIELIKSLLQRGRRA